MFKLKFFALITLVLSFSQQVYARHDMYAYFENPDPTVWRIQQYNGPGPNQDYLTPEGTQVLCWIIHPDGRGIDVKLESINNPAIVLTDVTFQFKYHFFSYSEEFRINFGSYYPTVSKSGSTIWVMGGDRQRQPDMSQSSCGA